MEGITMMPTTTKDQKLPEVNNKPYNSNSTSQAGTRLRRILSKIFQRDKVLSGFRL